MWSRRVLPFAFVVAPSINERDLWESCYRKLLDGGKEEFAIEPAEGEGGGQYWHCGIWGLKGEKVWIKNT
jgi:hypothetical protein